MKTNTVKKNLARKEPSIGSWLNLASPLAAEYMAHVGWDWLVVDTEHSVADAATASEMFRAICTTDTIPMARAVGNDPLQIKRLLDAGALGLVIPMIKSADEAQRAVKAMKYPPEGDRSAGGGRTRFYGSDYVQNANAEIAVIMQIEHAEGVRNVREILAVPGVDISFIGPNDLSRSLGCRMGAPEHEEAIQEVLRASLEAGIPTGIHCWSASEAGRRIDQGFRFIAIKNDVDFMFSAARTEIQAMRPSR
jgi:4-hydroxy-2-oxoheptanedioate aldolase